MTLEEFELGPTTWCMELLCKPYSHNLVIKVQFVVFLNPLLYLFPNKLKGFQEIWFDFTSFKILKFHQVKYFIYEIKHKENG